MFKGSSGDVYMTLELIIGVLLFLILLLWIFKLKQSLKNLSEENSELKYKRKSMEIKYGKSWEQFVPFMKNFQYSKENFKFFGEPIDGIAFEDNEVVFCEIKTGQSQLTNEQRRIRNLISEGKVRFDELRY